MIIDYTFHSAQNNNSDVTLVSDDLISFHAHRFIISCCSPNLKNLLVQNKDNKNPILYLKGVRSTELRAILEVIYFGQTSINRKDVEKLHYAAKDLQIDIVFNGVASSGLSDMSIEKMKTGFLFK